MKVNYIHHMFTTDEAEELYKEKFSELNWCREAFHHKRTEKDKLVVRLSYGKSNTVYLVGRNK